jgi:hypothetical protein
MVALPINTFGGMLPAYSDELLPGGAAALSENTWLYSGSLVGLPTPKRLRTLLIPDSSKVYRIPESYDRSAYLYNSLWLEFSNVDTDVVRAPVFGDTHDRYYYASTSDAPRYNTRARIEAGAKGELDSRAWLLGVPPPTLAPKLEVTGGSVKIDNVRVATTVAGELDKDFIEGETVDGVVLKKGDRIFIKDQADGKENGIRIVVVGTGTAPNKVGIPPRAKDMDTVDEFVDRFFKVLEGTVNGGSSWEITNETPPVFGTTAITSKEVSDLPLQVTRSYVYTWVTEYKEESAPSPPVIVTGIQDGSWDLSEFEIPSAQNRGFVADPSAERWITKTRIYRTVTSTAGIASFFFVAEQDCMTDFYKDTIDDDEVSSNAQLESFNWLPPPEDLKGLVVMWNGILAGWRANELWMCEPYRPHAWPSSFVNTLEYPIVGLGVAGQTLVVCTIGHPVMVNGALPEHMTTAKVSKFEPCISRGSILSSAAGVLFASPNGLVLCAQGSAVNLTKDLITRDKWQQYTKNTKLRAAWLGSAYYAFGGVTPGAFELTAWAGNHNDFQDDLVSPMEDFVSKFDDYGAHNGVLIDPADQRIAFNLLTSDTSVFSVQNDIWSGEVFLLRNGEVQWLDISDLENPIEPCTWRSKIFQMQDKKNLAAMRVFFRETPALPVLNPFRNEPPLDKLKGDQWGLCRIYADGKLKYTQELRTSGELWRLPSGFMADFWQYEIETRLKIINIQIASSVKELATV